MSHRHPKHPIHPDRKTKPVAARHRPDPARRQALGMALLGLPALISLGGCFGTEKNSVPDLPFTQLDGSKHQLSELKGKVVLINFWATSCSTCVREMPKLVSTFEKFRSRGFETLGIAMSYDPPAYVMQFAQSRKLPFRLAIDHDGKLANGFGPVQLTPTTFLVNKQGAIVKRFVGEPDFDALHALIDQLLAQA